MTPAVLAAALVAWTPPARADAPTAALGNGSEDSCPERRCRGAAIALQEAFVDVAARSKPAVVNLSTIHEEQVRAQAPRYFFGDPDDMMREFMGRPPGRTYRYRAAGTGTGFIIDPKGYLLTNDHVIGGATEIKVTRTLPSGKDVTYTGRVVGRDPNLDLAVVKIMADEDFPYLNLADSSKVRVGEWAVAIGSPFALEQTVTAGIISAVRQSLYIEGRRYANMIQTDAAINRGNSGGPLLNLQGQVVGVNTAIYSPSGSFAGIGFAIGSNEVKAALDALLAGRKLRRAWAGLEAGPVDAVVKRRFALPSADGALVDSVATGGPADKAGVRRGDVIRGLDGAAVKDPRGLVEAVSRLAPGKRTTLRVYRNGAPIDLPLTLGERPQWADSGRGGRAGRGPTQEPGPGLGAPAFTWKGADFQPAEEGVAVSAVAPDSPLAGFLLPGDVVRGVNDASVSTIEDLRAAAKRVKASDGVFLDIVRDGRPLYLSVGPSRAQGS